MLIPCAEQNLLFTLYQIELYTENYSSGDSGLRLKRSYRGLKFSGEDCDLMTDGEGREDEGLAIRILIQNAHRLEKLRIDLERMLMGDYPKVVVKKYVKPVSVKKVAA